MSDGFHGRPQPHQVFLFYSDHGAAGVVGMPEGPFLYGEGGWRKERARRLAVACRGLLHISITFS
jgi:hypothetical protein